MYDLNLVEKEEFKCVKFPDGSVYYGETRYVDGESGILYKDKSEHGSEDENKECNHLQEIRHGNGIQLFGEVEEKMQASYEGEWVMDSRSGKGKCVYKDGSSYTGLFKEGLFEGEGTYVWAEGHTYTGFWKGNKMEGKGEFVHATKDLQLSGIFRNNYYIDGDTQWLLNPFLSPIENELFKAHANQYLKSRERDREVYERQVKLIKINTHEEFAMAVTETTEEKRMPLVLVGKESGLLMEDVLNKIKMLGKYVERIDVRKVALDYGNPINQKATLEDVKRKMVNVVTQQGVLFLNLDESPEVEYSGMYDPDIKEFYGEHGLPSQMWESEQLLQKDVWSHYIGERDVFLTKKVPEEGYLILVWSKFKLDEMFDDAKILERVEQRFQKSLPFSHLNLLFVMNLLVPDTDLLETDERSKSQTSLVNMNENPSIEGKGSGGENKATKKPSVKHTKK